MKLNMVTGLYLLEPGASKGDFLGQAKIEAEEATAVSVLYVEVNGNSKTNSASFTKS
jgi:hypothetical protein